ncbi:hypothetical protein GCM10010273_09800 [Streptomyces lavendulocolor]
MLLGEYFDTGRLPPAEIIRVIRSQSWRDLDYKDGSLDVVGDRLYVLSFRSKKENKAQVRKRIGAHESDVDLPSLRVGRRVGGAPQGALEGCGVGGHYPCRAGEAGVLPRRPLR